MANKNNDKNKIQLSSYELEHIQYDFNYYCWEMSDKAYYLGYVPTTRLQRIRGKRDTYYTMLVDQKGYRVLSKTNNPALAEWSFNNAPMHNHFLETFAIIKAGQNGNNNGNKNVMNRSVKKNNKKDRAKGDIVLTTLWSLDLKPKDTDDELIYQVKRNLNSIRPKDLEVTIIPEKTTEM